MTLRPETSSLKGTRRSEWHGRGGQECPLLIEIGTMPVVPEAAGEHQWIVAGCGIVIGFGVGTPRNLRPQAARMTTPCEFITGGPHTGCTARQPAGGRRMDRQVDGDDDGRSRKTWQYLEKRMAKRWGPAICALYTVKPRPKPGTLLFNATSRRGL